jgi:hypothetical protein
MNKLGSAVLWVIRLSLFGDSLLEVAPPRKDDSTEFRMPKSPVNSPPVAMRIDKLLPTRV